MNKLDLDKELYKLCWKVPDFIESAKNSLFKSIDSLSFYVNLIDFKDVNSTNLKQKFKKFNSELTSCNLKFVHYNQFNIHYKFYRNLSVEIKKITDFLIWEIVSSLKYEILKLN